MCPPRRRENSSKISWTCCRPLGFQESGAFSLGARIVGRRNGGALLGYRAAVVMVTIIAAVTVAVAGWAFIEVARSDTLVDLARRLSPRTVMDGLGRLVERASRLWRPS